MTISAEKLRSGARTGKFVAVEAIDALILADAMEIADSCARSDIECFTREDPQDDPYRWWNINTADPCNKEMIDTAMRYLHARGLVFRHATIEGLVRFPS